MTCPDCEPLRTRIRVLEGKLEERERTIAELKRRLALYENPHTPPSRRRYPTRSSARKDGRRFPGRPRGHPGSTRPRPRPDVVKAPPWKESCEGCGAPLRGPSSVDHNVVEEIGNPSPKQVIDFLEFQWECGTCGSSTVSRHPDCPPSGRFGRNVLVQATLMKFEERLPYVKVCESLDRTYGLRVTPATALDITRRVCGWLRPEYERVLRRIRAADVVYVDETGAKVDGDLHWTWAFTTPSETLVAIRKSRGKLVLEEILGEDFDGVIVCDGWSSYPSFTKRIQRDWAHLLREADWLAERVEEAMPLRRALHRLYMDLKTSLLGDPPPRVRMRLRRNAVRRLRYWLDKGYGCEETVRFVQKVWNGFDYWFTFVTTPGVEPTSNRAERALREHVVQRKIFGTFRNGKGTRIYETVMTLLATWKQRGLDPSRAMADSLTATWTRS